MNDKRGTMNAGRERLTAYGLGRTACGSDEEENRRRG